MIHDKQRQSLIAHNKAKISAITSQFLREKLPGVREHLNNELESAKTALASLEAEPLGWCLLGLAPAFTADKSKADYWISRDWDVRPVYTVPPVSKCLNHTEANAEKLCGKWKEEAIKAHEESEELQSRCEVLVRENAIMRSAINQTIGWQESVDADNVESVRALHELQTPATDGILNALRAEGAQQASVRIKRLHTAIKEQYHGVINECADVAMDVAQQLRAGKRND